MSSFGPGCSDDDKYMDSDAWWDPYCCCDQFFTNTGEVKIHKLLMHSCDDDDHSFDDPLDFRHSFDDDDYSFDDDDYSFDDPLDFMHSFDDDSDYSFDDPLDCGYASSEDEALEQFLAVTSSMSSPATKFNLRKFNLRKINLRKINLRKINLRKINLRKFNLRKSRKPRSQNAEAFKGAHPYTCGKCGEWPFQSLRSFLEHMAEDHRTSGVCEIECHADQTTEFPVEYHYSYARNCARNRKDKSRGGGVGKFDKETFKKGDKDRFSCLTCEYLSSSFKAFNQHYAIEHRRCRICRIQFDKHDFLQYFHFSTSRVHLKKYCVSCQMAFASTNSLSLHCSASHPTEKKNDACGVLRWPCDACITKGSRTFLTEEELEAHLESEHIRCFPCNREFAQSKSLYAHLASSMKHNFCTRCESDFVSTRSFSLHNCPGEKAPRGSQTSCSALGAPSQNTSVADARPETEDPLKWTDEPFQLSQNTSVADAQPETEDPLTWTDEAFQL